jgi:hypothetical protein
MKTPPLDEKIISKVQNDWLLHSLRFFLHCSDPNSENYTSLEKPEFVAALKAFSMLTEDSPQYQQACFELGEHLLVVMSETEERSIPMALQFLDICRRSGFTGDRVTSSDAASLTNEYMHLLINRLPHDPQEEKPFSTAALFEPITDKEFRDLKLQGNHIPKKAAFNSGEIRRCIDDLEDDIQKIADKYRKERKAEIHRARLFAQKQNQDDDNPTSTPTSNRKHE